MLQIWYLGIEEIVYLINCEIRGHNQDLHLKIKAFMKNNRSWMKSPH